MANEHNNDTLALDTELELEDGTVITLGDLMRRAQETTQLHSQVEELTRFQENATRLMRGETPDLQAAYEVLRGAGFSEEEAREYAQDYVDTELRGGQETDENDNSGSGKPDLQSADEAEVWTEFVREAFVAACAGAGHKIQSVDVLWIAKQADIMIQLRRNRMSSGSR
jgi:hypothetical protein